MAEGARSYERARCIRPAVTDARGRPLDVIELRGLTVDCIVGVYHRERVTAQPLRLDVALFLDTREAAVGGKLAHTVNYGRLAGELRFLLEACRCHQQKSTAGVMDAFASNSHIGMVFTRSLYGGDQIVEAKCESCGTNIFYRTYRSDSSYGGVGTLGLDRLRSRRRSAASCWSRVGCGRSERPKRLLDGSGRRGVPAGSSGASLTVARAGRRATLGRARRRLPAFPATAPRWAPMTRRRAHRRRRREPHVR